MYCTFSGMFWKCEDSYFLKIDITVGLRTTAGLTQPKQLKGITPLQTIELHVCNQQVVLVLTVVAYQYQVTSKISANGPEKTPMVLFLWYWYRVVPGVVEVLLLVDGLLHSSSRLLKNDEFRGLVQMHFRGGVCC
jgi:hypothetical protein